MNNIQKEALLKKRYNAEKRFKLYGILSIFLAISFLFILIFRRFFKNRNIIKCKF
jgi:phosphate transport system permease protein